MSESIIEQIAQWLEAAIAEVTTANSYQQTLSVKRPEDNYIDPASIADLDAIVVQGDCLGDKGSTQEHYFWKQQFIINVHFFAKTGTSLSLDTRINRAAADIYKRLGTEMQNAETNKRKYCNQLAYQMDLLPPSIEPVEEINATVLLCALDIYYEVSRFDPYSQ